MGSWSDKDFAIFVQSVGRHWICPEDEPIEVQKKMQFLYRLASGQLLLNEPVSAMSKPAETKLINAMEAAIEADDHGAIWETWSELSQEEMDHMNAILDRHRRTRWKKAILAAGSTMNNADAPEPKAVDL